MLLQGVVVFNMCRGEVINQHSFYNVLKSGHLGAAEMDVWYHYPKNEASHSITHLADLLFGELEQVVLSSHRAGGLNSAATEQKRMEHLADLLNHATLSEPLPNRVDTGRRY